MASAPAVVLALACAAVAGEDPGVRQGAAPAEAALRVFETKCIECHGPGVPKPKGGFGTVTDLQAMAGDPALVVPGRPDKSEVYLRLVSGNPKERMPPAKARGGGLTPGEIEQVRRWIEAGAPPASPRGAAATEGHRHDEPLSGAARLSRWLGKFHPVVVHFPIALLLCAVLVELAGAALRRTGFDSIVTFCLLVGAAGAVASAGLGWLAAESEPTSGGTLLVHRWLGVATALVATVAACWRVAAMRRSAPLGLGFRLLLAGGGLLTAVAGHYGAMLVHGTDHFAW